MAELVDTYSEQASTVLVDPSSDVRRAALTDVAKLCLTFGRSKTNEVLLSRMITYLNDKDWKLRHAFLQNIVSVAAFVGSTSLEEFVLPLMEQALAGTFSTLTGSARYMQSGLNTFEFTDPEDYVVARVLDSLASLSEIRLFAKARMLELFSNCYGFLTHPNVWVRQGMYNPRSSVE
jgi:phosphoinositide-3-kinase regulatory subunit 4